MNKALRTCLRTTPRALRCQTGSGAGARSRCLASSICPVRNHGSVSAFASKSEVRSNGLGDRLRVRMQGREKGRGYSTREGDGLGVVGGDVEGGGGGVEGSVHKDRIPLETPEGLDEKEIEIRGLLVERLDPVALNVKDVSGGCGTMYSIDVVSERFRGLSMLKQQRLVNEALGGMIKGWHGVMLKTKAP
ncbi:BolA-like protein 3 [Lachnellula arida]|uniref:BolA-like protein 3 n=1 Tax=Lachnellula arida TaxID=1316785 RepID=A0A8T9BEX7_9HELO|nr:BolA-like protein 3 [Lachnellula arida]